MQLSKNFSLAELTRSATAAKFGIANTPNAEQVENLRALCVDCLQPARDLYGKPVIVNNGFRSQALNSAMARSGYRVSANSQHLHGKAADIRDADKTKNKKLFDVLLERGVFDQLIWEDGGDQYPDWIHVSYRKTGNRKQALRMRAGATTHRKYNPLTGWSV